MTIGVRQLKTGLNKVMGRNLIAWVSKTCGHRQADSGRIKPASETVNNPDPDPFRPQNQRLRTQNPEQTRPQPPVERGWADQADSRPPLRGARWLGGDWYVWHAPDGVRARAATGLGCMQAGAWKLGVIEASYASAIIGVVDRPLFRRGVRPSLSRALQVYTRSGTAISIKGVTSVSRWKQKTTSTRSFATWSGMPCVPTSWSERNRGVGRVCAVWSAKTRRFPSSRRGLCHVPPIGCNLSTNRKRKPKWRRCVAASIAVGPSAILTGSRTRPSDWGWNRRFGPVEKRRNNRRLATVTGGCLLFFARK